AISRGGMIPIATRQPPARLESCRHFGGPGDFARSAKFAPFSGVPLGYPGDAFSGAFGTGWLSPFAAISSAQFRREAWVPTAECRSKGGNDVVVLQPGSF